MFVLHEADVGSIPGISYAPLSTARSDFLGVTPENLQVWPPKKRWIYFNFYGGNPQQYWTCQRIVVKEFNRCLTHATGFLFLSVLHFSIYLVISKLSAGYYERRNFEFCMMMIIIWNEESWWTWEYPCINILPTCY